MYKSKLDEYRWTLRLSSKSAEFLERAISMLATSTGVLVKAIPSRPNTDFILNRHANRAAYTLSSSRSHQSDHASQVHSIVYLSESEIHDETSPENNVGETPSESGVANSDWNAEQVWFNDAVSSAEDVFVVSPRTNIPNAYMHMPDLGETRNGYNFS